MGLMLWIMLLVGACPLISFAVERAVRRIPVEVRR